MTVRMYAFRHVSNSNYALISSFSATGEYLFCLLKHIENTLIISNPTNRRCLRTTIHCRPFRYYEDQPTRQPPARPLHHSSTYTQNHVLIPFQEAQQPICRLPLYPPRQPRSRAKRQYYCIAWILVVRFISDVTANGLLIKARTRAYWKANSSRK